MIIINLKNYKTGKDVLDAVRNISIYYNKAILAVPAVEIGEVAKMNLALPLYAQHVDFHESGKGTGYIVPESLVSAGAIGSLLNHSEHKLKMSTIKETLRRTSEVGLKMIVFASSLREAKAIAKLNPYAIAFEDEKLAESGKSLTNQKSPELKKFVELLKDKEIIPLCASGIQAGEDVAAALILGCKGVVVSSAVANSQHPEKFLKEVSSIV